MSGRILRRIALAGLLALLLCLPSCFTMGLWGFYAEDEVDPRTGREQAWFVYDTETPWSWEILGLRVLLTPLTLVLDCATAPIQAFFLGDDDDDDC